MDSWSSYTPNDYGLVPRDFLSLLELDFDVEDQLEVIRSVFHRNRKVSRETVEGIKECREAANRLQGSAAEQAADDYGMLIPQGIFEDAAHGMSAIAMLAPLYERTLHQCLFLIGTRYHSTSHPDPDHKRWLGTPDHLFDCRYVWQGKAYKKDIHAGARQLMAALDLYNALPPDFFKVYAVIVAYRNKMFHHGLEWPLPERKAFLARAAADEWPQTWFSLSEFGSDPWMISLTDAFVDLCADLLIALTDLFGGYVRAKESATTSP